jgi:hypothetical protein
MTRQLAAVFFDPRLKLALLVCGAGMNSSLDTDWVGMGEGKADVSAGSTCSSSSALRNPIRTPLYIFFGGYRKDGQTIGQLQVEGQDEPAIVPVLGQTRITLRNCPSCFLSHPLPLAGEGRGEGRQEVKRVNGFINATDRTS